VLLVAKIRISFESSKFYLVESSKIANFAKYREERTKRKPKIK
jgi:hypothetical protein